jgi:hypothetical protein
MKTESNIPQRFKRAPQSDPATHLFAVGQAVRLNGGFLRSGTIYQITARLPPIGDSPQYRIRNDDEKFERVARQSELELSNTATDGPTATLVEKSFGLGQRS